ncbi:MAG: AbiV family abortive infection protein [Flavobacteriales bacterium]
MKKELNFLAGYKHSIQNAKELIELAKMASSICYGKANSLLILAVEESVKAGMLMSREFDPSQDEKDFVKYFSDHKFKHKSIRDIDRVGKLFSKILEVTIKPAEKAYNEKGDLLTPKEAAKAKKKGFDDLIKMMEEMAEADGTTKKVWNQHGIENDDDWWDQADHNKQLGFYVGYNKGSSKWEIPSNISKKRYEESLRIVTEFYTKIAHAETSMKDPNFVKMWDKVKNKK